MIIEKNRIVVRETDTLLAFSDRLNEMSPAALASITTLEWRKRAMLRYPPLSALPNLERIIVDSPKITKLAFSSAKSLRYLELINVTSIGAYAFFDCKNLKTLILPRELCSIAENAFLGCESLTDIRIPPDNAGGYKVIEGSLLTSGAHLLYLSPANIIGGAMRIPQGTVSAEKSTFAHIDRGAVTAISLPDTYTAQITFFARQCPALQRFAVAPGNSRYGVIDGILCSADKTKLSFIPRAYPNKEIVLPCTIDGFDPDSRLAVQDIDIDSLVFMGDVKMGIETHFFKARIKTLQFHGNVIFDRQVSPFSLCEIGVIDFCATACFTGRRCISRHPPTHDIDTVFCDSGWAPSLCAELNAWGIKPPRIIAN